MVQPYTDALAVSRIVLRLLIKLNLIVGVLILALLVASLVAEAAVMGALGARPGPGSSTLFTGMRLIMVIGISAVPIAHFVLTRLLTIVETVRRGNPFVIANAGRIQSIAWAMLGLELMDLAVGAIGAVTSTDAQSLHINWTFSVTGWLAVLLLFVLARVFEQGASMRDDLEATV